jgi:predicted dehydrogenase
VTSVGVAVLGCGLVGRKRVDALPAEAHLVCAYDPDRARAEALVDGVPDARVVSSAIAACTDDVDLVVVATPHRDLAPLAVIALDAGKHVLVEKPGAIDVEQARAAAERAAANDRVACVGFNHRFHPSLLEAKRIVDDGSFGPIMFVRGRYGHGGRIGYEREWRADPATSGGGELIDQGIHLVDLTRALAGDVELAFADLRTSFWEMPVEDNAFLALRCSSGAFAWLHASWTEWKNLFSLEVMLERAKIEISGLGGSYGTETLTRFEMLPEMGPPIVHRQQWTGADDSWARELEACVHAIRGQPTTGATMDDAVAALSVVDEAYRRGEGR